MGKKILAVNPGSTSTKIAVYEDKELVFEQNLTHKTEELEKFDNVQDQFEMRKDAVNRALSDGGFDAEEMDAVVGRGGILPPIQSGAYEVNNLMRDRLKNRPIVPHASNLGALIAYAIAEPAEKPSYIYDSVSVDEMEDVARISGMPEIPRASFCHALNSRAMAHKVAEKQGKTYAEMNFIVAHLGGGISVSAHKKGRMVDIIADDEGPFSPERAGRVPCKKLIDLCYSGKLDKKAMHKKLRGKGGLVAYTGTSDVREILERVQSGDDDLQIYIDAMAYQVSKGIGELATVLEGDVDAIIITGGIAHSQIITDYITRKVKFIALVEVMAGEKELESLAYGILRVLNGQENSKIYEEKEI